MKKTLFALLLAITVTSPLYAQGQVTLKTYYPSPVAAYDRLKLVPRGDLAPSDCDEPLTETGIMYVKSSDQSLQFCNGTSWGPIPGTWTQNGNNLYPTDYNNSNLKVGIGTDSPIDKLHLEGNLSFGSDSTKEHEIRFPMAAKIIGPTNANFSNTTLYVDSLTLHIDMDDSFGDLFQIIRGTSKTPIVTINPDPNKGYMGIGSNTFEILSGSFPNYVLDVQSSSGQVNPKHVLRIASNTETHFLMTNASNVPVLNPLILSERARGTLAAKQPVLNGDTLFEVGVWGWATANNPLRGDKFFESGRLHLDVDGPVGANSVPGKWVFTAYPDGSSTNGERMVIKSDGKVGIGTGTPDYLLDIAGISAPNGHVLRLSSNAETTLTLRSASDNPLFNPFVLAKRSRGTLTARQPVQDGDTLFEIWPMGWSTTANPGFGAEQYWAAGRIVMDVDGTPSGNSVPGKWTFWTTALPNTNMTERMVIDSVGRVRIGDFGSPAISTFDTGSGPNVLTLSGENRDVALISYGDHWSWKADLEFFRARGTPTLPTAVERNSLLGFVNFSGYPGDTFLGKHRIASIGAVMDDLVPSVTSLPTRLEFYTTPAGSTASQLRMVIKNNGRVGIGTLTPTCALDVAGNIHASGSITSSDKRWKKNIQPLDSPLKKINQLNALSFEWKKDEFKEMNFAEGRHIGQIAQDVEKVIPEVVSTDAKGYKSIEYANLVAYLIEAIKEQNSIIETQKQTLDELKQKIEALE
jgi:hypothetical protein